MTKTSFPLREGLVKKGGLNPPPTDYRPPPPQSLRPAAPRPPEPADNEPSRAAGAEIRED
jgi:hypothetical protein